MSLVMLTVFILICVARLVYSKGLDVLLCAWGRMMREPAEWRAHLKPRLRLVGGGLGTLQLQCMKKICSKCIKSFSAIFLNLTCVTNCGEFRIKRQLCKKG